jgi:hypothetical protein
MATKSMPKQSAVIITMTASLIIGGLMGYMIGSGNTINVFFGNGNHQTELPILDFGFMFEGNTCVNAVWNMTYVNGTYVKHNKLNYSNATKAVNAVDSGYGGQNPMYLTMCPSSLYLSLNEEQAIK